MDKFEFQKRILAVEEALQSLNSFIQNEGRRCENCKHWVPDEAAPASEAGICGRIKQEMYSEEAAEIQADDEARWPAQLSTLTQFCCSLWGPKP